MAETETGVIKRWISDRKFGFLTPDLGGVDVFFHLDAFQGDEPREGARVSYDTMTDARSGKTRAVNVRPMKSACEARGCVRSAKAALRAAPRENNASAALPMGGATTLMIYQKMINQNPRKPRAIRRARVAPRVEKSGAEWAAALAPSDPTL